MAVRTHRDFPAPKPPELISASEAAKRLCMSSQTVRDWFHTGRIKGIRIGHNIKLFADSVDALLNPITHKGI